MSVLSSAQIRQRALLAASSVVLALTLPGCLEPVADKATDTSASASADTSISDTATSDTASRDTATSDTASRDTASRDTSSSDTSSRDTAGGDTSGGDTSGGDTASGRPDCTTLTGEELSECCFALSDWCEAHFTEHMDQYECTFGDSGCNPWGPPAPPRMRAAVA